jgi:predicted PurR-regulated permease PerM
MFFTNFDYYAQSLQSFINTVSMDAAKKEIDISAFTKMMDNAIENLAEYIQANLGNIVNKSINVGVGIANTVISFILAIYMLCDKERLLKNWKRFLQAILWDKSYYDLASFWRRCNKILIRYIAGDLLDGLIVGILNAILMTISGMGYVALISVIVGLTNLAPTFGPFVGAVFGAFILVFVNPWHALWFIIITIVLQTLDAYVIKPKLFGNSLGISSLWILVSIIVLGRMLGIVGILLAIPFAAIFDILYKEGFLRRLEQRKKEKKKSLAEARAKEEAEKAAIKAAEEAIRAVVKKDSHLAGFEEEKRKLANDPATMPHAGEDDN